MTTQENKGHDSPRYQFSAAEADGASKYSIALLSTRRRAGKKGSISIWAQRKISQRAISVNDTCRLWERLHSENSPQIDCAMWILAFGRIPAQNKQIVAENPNQLPRCQLGCKTVHLDSRCVPLCVDGLKRNDSLPDYPGQKQGPIHN